MTVNVEFNVDQALAKLGELVAKHGPEAVNLASEVVRVNSLGNLVTGAAFAVAGVGVAVASAVLIRRFLKVNRPYSIAYRAWRDDRTGASRLPTGDDGIGWCVAGAMTGVFSGFLTVSACSYLLDVWTWVGLSNPKLALAHQVLQRLTGG